MFAPSASIFGDLFADSILNVIYAAALFIGVIYALFLMFFHGIGDALGDLDIGTDVDTSLDLDSDAAGEASGVSMLAIASFISAFGAFGLIAVTLLGAGSAASLIAALIGGVVMGLAAQAFFVYILSPTVSSEVRQTLLVGMAAEIITPIPPAGIGQVALVVEGSRMTYSARATSDGEAFPRGTPVRIERIVGGVVYVTSIA